jgi:hypothetical protein
MKSSGCIIFLGSLGSKHMETIAFVGSCRCLRVQLARRRDDRRLRLLAVEQIAQAHAQCIGNFAQRSDGRRGFPGLNLRKQAHGKATTLRDFFQGALLPTSQRTYAGMQLFHDERVTGNRKHIQTVLLSFNSVE